MLTPIIHRTEVLLLYTEEIDAELGPFETATEARAACSRREGGALSWSQPWEGLWEAQGVPSPDFSVNRMHWTVLEVIGLLDRAYLVDSGKTAFCPPDLITLEALAPALDARPEVLEQIWQVWEEEQVLADWAQERRDQARYWLDAVVIGGLIFP